MLDMPATCEEALDAPPPPVPGARMVLVVAAALVDRDGRVLLARRPEGKSMAGLWEFPGGKIQPGETPEYALMRELREELEIETRPCCFSPAGFASHAYPDFHLLMPLYITRNWRGTPRAREHTALKWLLPADLLDMPMPAADVPLVGMLRDVLG